MKFLDKFESLKYQGVDKKELLSYSLILASTVSPVQQISLGSLLNSYESCTL